MYSHKRLRRIPAVTGALQLTAGLLASFQTARCRTTARHQLRYSSPAKKWSKEALPLGNGQLGCMVYGGTEKEQIQFNHDTLWIGDETDTGAYQTFGDVFVATGHTEIEDYQRELDIDRAVQTITYRCKGVTYKREYFSSSPADVMIFRFTADTKGVYNVTVSLNDAHRATVTAEKNIITSSGNLAGYKYRKSKNPYSISLEYEAKVMVLNEGGKISTEDSAITLESADSFTVLLAAGTDYLNQRKKGWKGKHPGKQIARRLTAASKRSFDKLLEEHITDYRDLFGRLSLKLGDTPGEVTAMTTDARLQAYSDGGTDPGLEELLFQYARYLMISCSRTGTMPANLQGLWNQSNSPPWRCDYHTDVNIQMNYWFVDQANLSPCFSPLPEWINSIRNVRKEETKAEFNTRGWLTHAENGIFGGSTWKWSKGDAAWVAQNLWDHYAFTLDEEYLRTRAYPVMKELCEFWEDHLKELPDGTFVSPNGFSPEHGPHEDGVSFDQQLVWDLFTNYQEAAGILGLDSDFRDRISKIKERLLGPQIGKWGQLQEWMVDRDKPNDHHRHLSHLIAVHPGRQICPETTPEFADAAKVSMNARGDGATGWSKAWKISIWARLHDGDRAYKLLSEFMRKNVFDNLYGYHPPFQIDGNFGYAAGICEMLMQSHMGWIHLLPGLPKAWPEGEIRGICARNAFVLDISWKDNTLTRAVIRSKNGHPCRLHAPTPIAVTQNGKAIPLTREKNTIVFQTEPGENYLVEPLKNP